MSSLYSGSLVSNDHNKNSTKSRAEERDENSFESSNSEEEQSSLTTENSSEEEIDPRTTLINDAAPKVREQYDDILQALLMEGHDENEAKQEAFAHILPVFQRKLADVRLGMNGSIEFSRSFRLRSE